MLLRIRLTHLLFLLSIGISYGFVPQTTPFHRKTSLSARYTPPLTPPPPPPTPEPVEGWMQEATKTLNELISNGPQYADLSRWSTKTSAALQNLMSTIELKEQINTLRSQMDSLDAAVLQEIATVTNQFQALVEQEYPLLSPYIQQIQTAMPLQLTSGITFLMASVLSVLFAGSLWDYSQRGPSQPYPTGRYDPDTARAYFDRRLPLVLARGLSIALQSLQFGIGILSDKVLNKEEENSYQRGRELAILLTKLGPTFIKVGQSLSIRTDLLSPAYIRGLETLQDQVPAFDTAIATRILEQEWGRPVSQVLAEPLSSKPIAAASLGQVYKAKLKPDGEEVAIKVQRPDITEQIALDMYLVRNFATIAKSFFNLNTDTVGTVDAWGVGFVDELDYMEEARNAEFFSSKIAETPLREVVFAPTVVDSLSTRCVLVSEWVDGERLDRSTSEDVSVLCSIAMNTYLTMLLEMSILHCDPHPGNLLRVKKDGRLCILDWGMVTRLEPGLQLTLIEHMAHLTSSDYAEIPRDLLLLGFIPESKADMIEDSGVVDVLADIYGAWSAGGGAAAINVPDVINQLQDLTSKNGNLFQIPPYFAYIAKSFSVLEGIGLSNDPKYSIINECLPYVSNRLITDKENMGPALSTFIFGPEKSNKDRIVSYKRVKQLMEGFGEFTTSSSGALLGKNNFTRTELLDETTDQIMDLLFSDEETPLQQILLEQVAKVVTSSGRYILTNVREQSGILPTGRTLLGTLVDPLGFWRTSPLVRMNELDEKTINTTRQIVQLFQEQAQKTNNPVFDLSNLTREETTAIVSMLVRKIWSRRTGILQTSNRFARQLLLLTAEKLELGERDSRIVPKRLPPVDSNNNSGEGTQLPLTLPATAVSKESSRLQSARALLDSLQKDATSDLAPMPASNQPSTTQR
ncbi:hypothetical protein FisN_15Hh188 [Fistulifera solaris]|uniref:ABC1 atypical kinase-like domain-containing protein n=1 Tax=Fistulifera solaris TaxID=1519565 RepID=A0A1Z5JFG2_FISSO|nr:hypothetical protein FisN_15Hh188 [Fistulifera solaris]|eukprot:GAX12709.1 hypothetical protein FisN_15Hh188 [Fistulifera solaris]